MTPCLRMFLHLLRNHYSDSGFNARYCSINSKAAFFILKEAATHVPDGGKIITIVTALLAAFTGLYTSYAGSKAPVEHFTRYAYPSSVHTAFD